jgi:hypothetical protein
MTEAETLNFRFQISEVGGFIPTADPIRWLDLAN